MLLDTVLNTFAGTSKQPCKVDTIIIPFLIKKFIISFSQVRKLRYSDLPKVMELGGG